MKTMPFYRILEQASLAPGSKNLTGTVADTRSLLNTENLNRLEALHKGPYAFFAFNPEIDKSVNEYIARGSLASESGSRVMVLLFSETNSSAPAQQVGGMTIDPKITSTYEFVTLIAGTAVVFPGLLIFGRLIHRKQAAYILLENLTVEQITQTCRKAFAAANSQLALMNGSDDSFVRFCAGLASAEIKYQLFGEKSFADFLVLCYGFLRRHKAELMSLIKELPKFK